MCPHPAMKAFGLLALRVVIGAIFIYSGYLKLIPGHAVAAGLFTKMGFVGGGSFWAYFVGLFELVGGLMALLGIFAGIAAVWLAIIMVVAILSVHWAGPFTGMYAPLALLGGCLALMGVGAGPWRLVKCECCCKKCKAAMAEKSEGGCCDKNKKMDGGCGEKSV